jgi:Restriction Endonuclease associating with ARP
LKKRSVAEGAFRLQSARVIPNAVTVCMTLPPALCVGTCAWPDAEIMKPAMRRPGSVRCCSNDAELTLTWPLRDGFVERTEIDMKLGPVLFEAKLTESDFQTQKAAIIEGYRDLKEVFDCRKLSRRGQEYVSYQLLRNVIAAYALNLSFCVLLDARRPDLREQWYRVMSCVRPMDLKTRCKVLTWQELSAALPLRLQRFLELKYGIVS